MKQKNYITQNSAFLARGFFFRRTPANSFAIRRTDFGALRS